MEIATAASTADSQRLAAIAIELMESVASLRADVATLKTAADERRRRDRERKPARNPRIPRTSTDSVESPSFSPTPPFSTPASSSSSSAREELLSVVPNRAAWEGEITMCRDGARGAPYKANAEQMETACRDYLGNGASREPNMALFRSYIRRAVTGETPAPDRRRGGVGQRSHDNALEALNDVG